MSYANFKPEIWSATIERTLKQKAILTEFCNNKIKGEPAYGSMVHVLGAGVPTIRKYNPEVGLKTIDQPEGSVATILIDQANEFNFMVDDIDLAQTTPDLMPALMEEAAGGLARERDCYIAGLAVGAEQMSAASIISDSAAAKKIIDEGLRKLRENNVTSDKNVRIELSYWMYQLFRDYLVDVKTANDALLKNGTIGMYDGCAVAYSNNIHNDGEYDYCMIRTDKAIGLAAQVEKTEPYRPQNYFADAVKGLDVYGAKIIRQKELYVLKVQEGE